MKKKERKNRKGKTERKREERNEGINENQGVKKEGKRKENPKDIWKTRCMLMGGTALYRHRKDRRGLYKSMETSSVHPYDRGPEGEEQRYKKG